MTRSWLFIAAVAFALAGAPAFTAGLFAGTNAVEELVFEVWQHSYGGGDEEWISEFATAPDGGFLIAGTSYSPADGNKTAANLGAGDVWVVRIDARGEVVWDRAYGGAADE